MSIVIVLELDTSDGDTPLSVKLEEAVEVLKHGAVPHLTKVLRVADGEIASQILESINPPKGH